MRTPTTWEISQVGDDDDDDDDDDKADDNVYHCTSVSGMDNCRPRQGVIIPGWDNMGVIIPGNTWVRCDDT